MKKLISVLVVLALTGAYVPLVAQEISRSISIFRSMDDPDIPVDMDVCDRGQGILSVPFWNGFFGASTWALNTRAKDGTVVNEKVRQVGTGTACMLITDPDLAPFAAEFPFYFEGETPDAYIAAAGECKVTQNAWGSLSAPPADPEGPVFLACYMDVIPELSTEGIKWGQASSNSTLVPGGEIPGFETGSFWTIQVVWDEEE